MSVGIVKSGYHFGCSIQFVLPCSTGLRFTYHFKKTHLKGSYLLMLTRTSGESHTTLGLLSLPAGTQTFYVGYQSQKA